MRTMEGQKIWRKCVLLSITRISVIDKRNLHERLTVFKSPWKRRGIFRDFEIRTGWAK